MKNVFSSFVEMLGRCIYGGLYEPGHPTAYEDSFRGDVLEKVREMNLTMNRFPEVPYLDAQAVLNDDGGVTVFAINRSLDEQLELSAVLRGFEDCRVKEHIVLTADDPKATNTEENPDNVVPTADGDAVCENGVLKSTLRKMSWNVIRLSK